MADASEVSLRLFGYVTSKESSEGNSWGDVTWYYFRALNEHFKVRVMPNGLLHQVHISKGESRWGEHSSAFAVPLESSFVNVVCGTKEDLQRYWTRGVINVAITTLDSDFDKSWLRNQVQKQWADHMAHAKEKYGAVDEGDDGIYRRYDLVVCLTSDDAVALKQSGVVAKHLQPGECAAAILNLTKGPSE